MPALLFLAAEVWRAEAGEIFSNLGHNDTFDSSGFGVGFQAQNNRGARFTVGGIGGFFFSGADIALQHLGGNAEITFGLRVDTDGVPGNLLQNITVSGISSTPPGELVRFSSVNPLYLYSGTTYWLTSEAYSPSEGEFAWRMNNTFGETGNAVRLGSEPWFLTSQSTPAFRINGTSVPEPNCPVLLSLGLLGLCVRHFTAPRRPVPGEFHGSTMRL